MADAVAPTDAPADPMHGSAPDDQVERWFVHRGVPHFIEGYNAREDILTRAAPFLLLVFVGELFNAINREWSFWANVAAVVADIVATLGGFAVVNRIRGRRAFALPDDIGTFEIAAFILVPALVPLVFGGQVAQSLEVLGANIVLLGLSYLVVSYGLLPMARWATGQMLRQMRSVGDLMVRSLPLLLLFSMVMFFNAEMWKICDDLPLAFMAIAMLVVLVVGGAFVVLRLPGELEASNRFESWPGMADLLVGTPVEGADLHGLPNPPAIPPLGRRARINISLVQFVRQSIQILLVTVVLWAFYVVFGVFTIIPSTVEQWTGSGQLDVLWSVSIAGHEAVLSGELLRTSVFIAAVAGLQFTVQAVTESSYRDEFLAASDRDTRQSLAVRAVYLCSRAPHSR